MIFPNIPVDSIRKLFPLLRNQYLRINKEIKDSYSQKPDAEKEDAIATTEGEEAVANAGTDALQEKEQNKYPRAETDAPTAPQQ